MREPWKAKKRRFLRNGIGGVVRRKRPRTGRAPSDPVMRVIGCISLMRKCLLRVTSVRDVAA
jgi:hypothetical protein